MTRIWMKRNDQHLKPVFSVMPGGDPVVGLCVDDGLRIFAPVSLAAFQPPPESAPWVLQAADVQE